MVNKLDAALALAARGFNVFPIKAGAKAPPLLPNWPERATRESDVINVLWSKWPDANIGIHCGGMVVIDVDVKNNGEHALAMLALTEGLPGTLVTLTPSGGRHLFYRLPKDHPGVPNSVSSLGAGLDIRSTGGYVVAPGSVTEKGEYRFADNAAISDAPEWLVPKLGVIVPKLGTDAPIPDAPDVAVERARTWLAGQAGAVEGQGGDHRTFVVAAGLRDMGLSAQQAEALMWDWNLRCSPSWTPAQLKDKVLNAYKYAQNQAGASAALPQDFPLVQAFDLFTFREQTTKLNIAPTPDAASAAIQKGQPRRFLAFANSETHGPGYLIKGLLHRRTYAEMFGAPGAGKTFVALDIAYHVAAGKPWMGRNTHNGLVLYLAYEGTGGLVNRAKALHAQYGNGDVPLYIVHASFNLRDLPGRAALGEVMAKLPEKPVLIIIDTFARALMGGDENSAQDVGAFNTAVAALIENTDACVMIVHHSGKDKSKGARGSSALLGAIDTELEIDEYEVRSSKQRDVEPCAPIGFKLVPRMVDMDSDGEEVTSCTVAPNTTAKPASGHLKGHAQRGWNVLCSLSPNNAGVTEKDWREACKAFMGEDNKKASSTFFDLKTQLMMRGYIVKDDAGLITRRMK